MTAAEMTFTGRNAAAVKAWVNETAPTGTTYFVSRSMAASTGGQAWRFVSAGHDWPHAVSAAVYDEQADEWRPVTPGDVIVRTTTGYGVLYRARVTLTPTQETP